MSSRLPRRDSNPFGQKSRTVPLCTTLCYPVPQDGNATLWPERPNHDTHAWPALITPFIFLLSRQKKNETKRKGDFFQSLRGKKRLCAVLTCAAQRHGAGFLSISATILLNRLLNLLPLLCCCLVFYGKKNAPSNALLSSIVGLNVNRNLVTQCHPVLRDGSQPFGLKGRLIKQFNTTL